MAGQPSAVCSSLDSSASSKVSLYDFVAERYQRKAVLQRYYKSVEDYLPAYVQQNGLEKWLESIRGTRLNEAQTQEIGRIYVTHASREPQQIPAILVSLNRLFDIEAPVVEGILTVEYWESLLGNQNELSLDGRFPFVVLGED